MNQHNKYGGLKVTRLWLVASVIFLATVFPLVAAQTQLDYVNEFSEPGDSSSVQAKWEYVTQDGMHRTIEVYQYCQNGTCLLVPFDIENHVLLTDKQAQAFFENLAWQRPECQKQ